MSEVGPVWLDGGLRPAAEARVSVDDPGFRAGEGLVETMRAEGGDVAWLDRHLRRMAHSASRLGWTGIPPADEVEAAVRALLGVHPPGPLRVRILVTSRPTLLVEAAPVDALPSPPAHGRTAPGTWFPGRVIAEHKTTSYAGHLMAQRRAEASGADHALLLDRRGRLGEAALANVFVVRSGELCTAPADGLLPGIARARVIELAEVTVRAPTRSEWRTAQEVFLTNAVRGVVPLVRLDGAPVGDGRPGPVSLALADALRDGR